MLCRFVTHAGYFHLYPGLVELYFVYYQNIYSFIHIITKLLAPLTDSILVEAAQNPCPKVSRENRLSEWRVI